MPRRLVALQHIPGLIGNEWEAFSEIDNHTDHWSPEQFPQKRNAFLKNFSLKRSGGILDYIQNLLLFPFSVSTGPPQPI